MTYFIDNFILSYFLLVNTFYALLLGLAFFEIRRRKAERLPELDSILLERNAVPPITTIMPAFNESATIVESVKCLLVLKYPNQRIVVVNDGSTDDTLDYLIDEFDLKPVHRVVRRQIETEPIREIYRSESEPNLVVVDKKNGGKGDALNAGINVSRTPLICCVDADTLIAQGALFRMVEPFIHDPRRVVAVGGTVRIANGCRIRNRTIGEFRLPDSWLARFQIIEYLRAFLFGRMGMNKLGGNLIISGAFGLFLKEAVVEVGGYDSSNVTEDMELILRLHRYGRSMEPSRRIIQIPDPTSYTQAPEDFGTLRKQRDRWHRGMASSIWKHKSMLFNPKLDSLGFIVLPSYLFFELIGPLIELFGYGWFIAAIVFGFLDWQFALLFILLAFVWGALLSIQALVLDYWSFRLFRGGDSKFELFASAIFENLGYRQLTLLYRLEGFLKFLLGIGSWGSMRRKQFEKAPGEAARSAERSYKAATLAEESSHPVIANEPVDAEATTLEAESSHPVIANEPMEAEESSLGDEAAQPAILHDPAEDGPEDRRDHLSESSSPTTLAEDSS